MTDTASPRASPHDDTESYHTNDDGMEPETYIVSSFKSSDRDTDSSLTIMFCGLRMYVDIFAVNLQRSQKKLDEYLHFLKVADVYELDGRTVDDFYDWVFEGCSFTFAEVTPPALPVIPTLTDYLDPETRSYSLHANDHGELG